MADGATPTYPVMENLMEVLALYAPVMAGVLKDLRPLVEPKAASMLGISPWEMRNPLQRQLSTSMFTAADAAVWAKYQRDYTALKGDVRSETPLGGILAAVNREYLDKASMGATAYGLAMQRIGAGMSFATSVLGDRQPLALGGATPQDVTTAFVDTAGMPFKGLRPGERQLLLERMLRSDRSLLTGYSKDMDVVRDITTTDSGGMLTPKNMSFTKETTAILERVNTLRKGVKEMDAAVASWKEVLDRDVKQSLEAISSLFGGDAVATFSGSGDVLQRMALRVKHTAALTGNEAGYILGGVGSAMKMLGGLGAPQEAALLTTTFATGYAANLGGYRGSQETMEQGAALSAGHAIASPYGRMIAGAYMKYMGTEEGFKLGYGDQGRAGFRRFMQEKVAKVNGVYTAESLNTAFGGTPMTDAEFRRLADTDAARDFLSQDGFVITETINASRAGARKLYFETDRVARSVSTAIGENNFFAAMGKNPETARLALDDALKGQNWSEEKRRTAVNHLMQQTQSVVGNLKRSATGGWENLADMSIPALMRFLNPDAGTEYANRQAEVEARTTLDIGKARSGSLLMAGVDLFRQGGSVSVKGLFSAVTGLSGRDADLFYKMGGTNEQQKEAFVKAMKGLPDRIEKDIDPDKLAQNMFTQLRTSYDKGDLAETAIAKKDIVSVLGGSFEGDQWTPEGGAPTGKATEAVKRYKERTSDKKMREVLYTQAGLVPSTDYEGNKRKAGEWASAVNTALKEEKSLTAIGMRSQERDVAAVAAAMRMTIDTLAKQDVVDAYEKTGDGKYRNRSGNTISEQQYERMQRGAATGSQLSTMLKDGDFLKGDAEQRRKAVSLLQQTEQGSDLLTQARSMAGSSTDMGTWEQIIAMLMSHLSVTPLRIAD